MNFSTIVSRIENVFTTSRFNQAEVMTDYAMMRSERNLVVRPVRLAVSAFVAYRVRKEPSLFKRFLVISFFGNLTSAVLYADVIVKAVPLLAERIKQDKIAKEILDAINNPGEVIGMTRSGRIDEVISVDDLDVAAVRRLILATFTPDQLSEDIGFEEIAEAMKGFKPAFIQNTFMEVKANASFRTGSNYFQLNTEDFQLNTEDFLDAINKRGEVIGGTDQWADEL